MLGALDVTVESFRCGKVLVIVIHSACIGHHPPGLQSGRMLRRSLTRVKPSLANVPVLTSDTSAKQPGCLPPNTCTHAGARSPVGPSDCAAGQDRRVRRAAEETLPEVTRTLCSRSVFSCRLPLLPAIKQPYSVRNGVLYSFGVTERVVLAAIDDIHNNSVRRRLVAEATQWEWSRARWYASNRELTDPDLPTIHGLPWDFFA